MASEQEDRAIRMGELIVRRITGQLAPDEEQELDDWLGEFSANRQPYTGITIVYWRLFSFRIRLIRLILCLIPLPDCA